MSEILTFGFGMPAFQAALLGCLQTGGSLPAHGAITEKLKNSGLAFGVEVSTWKTLA